MAQETKAEKEAREAAEAAEAAKPKQTIEFFGPGREVTIRRLTVNDFELAGIPQPEDVDWKQANGWMVPVEDFKGKKSDVLAFFAAQSDFRIAEEQHDAEPEA